MATMQRTANVAHCKGAVPVHSQRAIETQVLRSNHNVGLPSYPLSSKEFVKEFVAKNVNEWSEQLLEPSNIATTLPHATFTAFGHGYMHKPSKEFWQTFYHNLARIFHKSCKNLARILARLLARMSNNHARFMQDS